MVGRHYLEFAASTVDLRLPFTGSTNSNPMLRINLQIYFDGGEREFTSSATEVGSGHRGGLEAFSASSAATVCLDRRQCCNRRRRRRRDVGWCRSRSCRHRPRHGFLGRWQGLCAGGIAGELPARHHHSHRYGSQPSGRASPGRQRGETSPSPQHGRQFHQLRPAECCLHSVRQASQRSAESRRPGTRASSR